MDVILHESMDLGRRMGWDECLDEIFGNSNDVVNHMRDVDAFIEESIKERTGGKRE